MISFSTKPFQVLLEVHKELEAKKAGKNSKSNSVDRGDEADPTAASDTASVTTTDTAVSVEVAGAAALAE